MPRHVTITSVRGIRYIRICESYRNSDGKPRSKTIESFGSLEKALRQDPEFLEKLKARVERENELERLVKKQKRDAAAALRTAMLEKQALPENSEPLFAERISLGGTVLRAAWSELKLPELFAELSSKKDDDFPYDENAFLFACGSLMRTDKKSPFENKAKDILATRSLSPEETKRLFRRFAEDRKRISGHLARLTKERFGGSSEAVFCDFSLPKTKDSSGSNPGTFGILTDRTGFPLGCEMLPGGPQNTKEAAALVRKLKKVSGIKRITAVSDRGFETAAALSAICRTGEEFILSRKVSGLPAELHSLIENSGIWSGTIEEDGETLCRYMDRMGEKNEEYGGLRWFVGFSPKLAARDISESTNSASLGENSRNRWNWAGCRAVCASSGAGSPHEVMTAFCRLLKTKEFFLPEERFISQEVLSGEMLRDGYLFGRYLALMLLWFVKRVLEEKVKKTFSASEAIEMLRSSEVARCGSSRGTVCLRLFQRGFFDEMLQALSLESPSDLETQTALLNKLRCAGGLRT